MAKLPFETLALDNAGKFYPGQNSNRWSNVYRLSVELKEEIDPVLLKKALDKTLDRIPTFKVRIRNGFFRNYFEINNMDCPVYPDIRNCCYRVVLNENNGFPFRIYYHRNRVNADVYHSLADGFGVSTFMFTLIGEYLRLKGYSIPYNQFVLNVNDEPTAEEMEDAYERYATSDKTTKLGDGVAYHMGGTSMPLYTANYTTLTMSFKELHAISKNYGVTVTEFLAAVLVEIHCKKQLADGKSQEDIIAQIPLNLRKLFPSASLRNFVASLPIKIPYRPEGYTFEELLKSISTQLREANDYDSLHSFITQTVDIQSNKLKYVPLAIKNTAIKIGFNLAAERSTSVLLTNLGPSGMPDEMKEHVNRLFVYVGAGLVNGTRCGIASIDDTLTFTFSNCFKEDIVERELMEKLISLGVNMIVETNRDNDFSDIEGIKIGDPNAYADVIYNPENDKKIKFKNPELSLSERIKRKFQA